MRGLHEMTPIKWRDADTADVLVHLFPVDRMVMEDAVRLNRIDAAKKSTANGMAAWQFVLDVAPVGQVLDVQVLKRERYGRLLSEVWLPDGANLSDLLVHGGFAVYWDGTGSRPLGSSPRIEVPAL